MYSSATGAILEHPSPAALCFIRQIRLDRTVSGDVPACPEQKRHLVPRAEAADRRFLPDDLQARTQADASYGETRQPKEPVRPDQNRRRIPWRKETWRQERPGSKSQTAFCRCRRSRPRKPSEKNEAVGSQIFRRKMGRTQPIPGSWLCRHRRFKFFEALGDTVRLHFAKGKKKLTIPLSSGSILCSGTSRIQLRGLTMQTER